MTRTLDPRSWELVFTSQEGHTTREHVRWEILLLASLETQPTTSSFPISLFSDRRVYHCLVPPTARKKGGLHWLPFGVFLVPSGSQSVVIGG